MPNCERSAENLRNVDNRVLYKTFNTGLRSKKLRTILRGQAATIEIANRDLA